jgi:hypothetical protein
MKLKVPSEKRQVTSAGARFARRFVCRSSLSSAFTLIEVLVVVTLLALIILALMAVFNGTQTAFRSGVTQSDVLEGGRSTMELMAQDLREMTAANQTATNSPAVNFYVVVPAGFTPLVQSLTATANNRTNVVEAIFILGRENMKWTGAGYVVNSASNSAIYPLYRFYAETNIAADPRALFNNFFQTITNGQWNNSSMSHLLDGVVHFTVRAYDPNGIWLTNGYGGLTNWTVRNAAFLTPQWGEVGMSMFGGTLPAAVDIQLGVLEDRTLQRAGTWQNGSIGQSNYLSGRVGAVHLFRQHVLIPNVDPSVYQ